MAAAPPHRRWLRFGLRPLFIFVLIVGGILGYYRHRISENHRIIKEIEACGGGLNTHLPEQWQIDVQMLFATAEERENWPWFGELRYVELSHTTVDDAWLQQLSRYQRLDTLYLGYCENVSDQGVQAVSGIESLERLDLSGTTITDRGMAYLTSLPQLRELGLANTSITDEGLQQLRSLRNLEAIAVQGAPVTRSGIERLHEQLPNCAILY